MCGRYAFNDIEDIYEVRKIIDEVSSNMGGSAAAVKTGEVFPSETAAVVVQRPSGQKALAMAWGYPAPGGGKLLINARSETLTEKPMFSGSLLNGGRCLIPCTGFYEWKTAGKTKQKLLVRPEAERFFYLAGLYRRFGAEERFVIITTPASEQMKEVHDRMPLMIKKGSPALWFSYATDCRELIEEIQHSTGQLEMLAV